MKDQRKYAVLAGQRAAGGGHQQRAVKGGEPARPTGEPARPVGERDRKWPGTLMALGVISLVVHMVTVVRWTLIEPATLLRALALLCFIGSVLPYRRAAYRWGMARLEWFLFNLLAVGPLFMGLLLWANFLFHGPPTTSDHQVSEVSAGNAFRMHTFADGLWTEYPLARLLSRETSDALGYTARITTARGLLGVPVVVDIKAPHRSP